MKLGSFINYVQWWLQNAQKRMIHMQKSFFANIYLHVLLFCCSRCRCHHHCFSSLWLWFRSFATMVMWRHTYLSHCCFSFVFRYVYVKQRKNKNVLRNIYNVHANIYIQHLSTKPCIIYIHHFNSNWFLIRVKGILL